MTWADFVVRGTLVLAAGFLASFAFGRASAALRHLIWTAAFLALVAMPVAWRMAPKIELAAWPAAPAVRASEAAASPAASPAEPARTTPTRAFAAGAGAYTLALYLTGLLLVASRFLAGAVRTMRMVRQARPAPYAQPLADSVRRHDLLAQLAAQAACCLYWFHPLVWLAAQKLRKERERACDDAVLSGGVPAPDYAGHLLELARVLVQRRSLADAPAMAETGDLEDRVRAVLDDSRNRAPLNRRLAATVAAIACALVLPVALVTLHAQAGTGTLAGVVQDSSKARVPGCSISIKNMDGKNEEVSHANAAGEFGFANIPAGHYSIEARSGGFAPAKTEVLVEAGRRVETLVVLPLGQISEAMTVRGTRPAPAADAPKRTVQRIRIPVGGNVQAAKLVKQVQPVYPADLKEQGVTGTVMLRAVISTTGEMLKPEVVNTVHPGLAQAALDAVRQWRYQPTLLNGQPVEVVTTVTVTFELDQ